ncbi:hypothetical protein PISL3812_03519 [Talaromyces islandicus]|uniref:Uncharacterized protein n=1 Tax=Talaromyces islandicus TaxID=28573 RepID=A0A0U1LSX9_TALIS|nr:hypothetical protein PISL3812_03519 [Talaromyces islandicus]
MAAIRPLLGKTAVVTGSSSGNGRAIALTLAKAGANVVCSDLTPDPRSEGYEEDGQTPTHQLIASRVGKEGGSNNTLFQACDVQYPKQISDLIKRATSEFGRLDIMVNNAGILARLGTIVDSTEDDYDRTMAVNVKGTYFGCKYAIEQFIAQQKFDSSSHSIGKIINFSSIGGVVGLKDEPAYCASKGAVVNLTKQLAVDFGKKGVNVNAICPGFLQTAMVRPFLDDPERKKFLGEVTPWPTLGVAQDVANATLWLSSPESDYVTGSALTIDGGYTAR